MAQDCPLQPAEGVTMISHEELRSYVRWEDGLISPHIFSSDEIYELEMKRVFGRCWLFLAHDSQIPRPGDYFATYMGADPVLIVRQADGSVAAFLNACRHRGMKVCRGDEGNSKAFTCNYHGWSYDTAGRLVSVPSREHVYGEDFDMSRWGLAPVARLDHYQGFWFGSFDPSIVDLDTYLGPFRYHMDTFLDTMPGGIEFIGGTQKAAMGGTWKFAAEQFAGDSYHAATSHISDFAVTTPPELMPVRDQSGDHGPVGFHQFSTLDGHGAGFNTTRNPRRFAAAGATDVIDQYQDSIEPDVLARYGEDAASIYRGVIQHANVFPNLSFLSNPTTVRVWHPKGPGGMEMYSWVYVDKDAPAEVKDQLRWITQHHFGPQGLAEQDDGENFSAIGSNLSLRGPETHKLMLHYRMGLSDTAGDTQSAEGGRVKGMGEMPQRLFYRRWLELMTDSGE
jgi:3-phenylpropionate/trans-cinnamate dioxygenase alpha subunit